MFARKNEKKNRRTKKKQSIRIQHNFNGFADNLKAIDTPSVYAA